MFDTLTLRGAASAFVFGILFRLGWGVGEAIAHLISSLFR